MPTSLPDLDPITRCWFAEHPKVVDGACRYQRALAGYRRDRAEMTLVLLGQLTQAARLLGGLHLTSDEIDAARATTSSPWSRRRLPSRRRRSTSPTGPG
jgi:hypothetical protein